MFGEAGKLPMNSPQCHICFRGAQRYSRGRRVGEWGACWRTLWLLSYTKQMRLGVELLFWELLGKPQLTGKPGRMRIWVHCNLLHRPFPPLYICTLCNLSHPVVEPSSIRLGSQQPVMTKVFYVSAFFVVYP